jgi:hypothetical protein
VRRHGALPGLGHVPQIPRPSSLPPAVQDRHRRCRAFLPNPMLEGHKEAVAPDRQRGPIAPRGGTRLFKPGHDVLDLRNMAVRGHASAQARQHLAQRSARPMDIVIPRQHGKYLPLGVISCPLTNALSSRRGC